MEIRLRARPPPSSSPLHVSSLVSVLFVPQRVREQLRHHLLPKDFPASVGPGYLSYASLHGLASIFSAAGGVLSMQSLLYAVGLGAGAIPMAAALNWVLKDGLGQLGGVLFAGVINNRFDRDVKRWRTVSAVAQDAATLLEILIPIVPHLFLPLASLANIGKNVAWLSASATRAGIHQTLARQGNLADITAKAGSQTIAASLLGTGLGIALSPLVGNDPFSVLVVFLGLAAVHQGSLQAALRSVPLPTLNCTRLDQLTADALEHWGPPRSQRAAVPKHGHEDGSAERAATEWVAPTPTQLLERETILGPGGAALWRGPPSPFTTPWLVAPSLAETPRLLARIGAVAEAVPSSTERPRYFVAVEPAAPGAGSRSSASPATPGSATDVAVAIVWEKHAEWQDVLVGALHAGILRDRVDRARARRDAETGTATTPEASWRAWEAEADELTRERATEFVRALERSGWWIGQPLVESDLSLRIER